MTRRRPARFAIHALAPVAGAAALLALWPAGAVAQSRDIDPEGERIVVPDLVDEAQPTAPAAERLVAVWPIEQATALRRYIDTVDTMGLIPADYLTDSLDAALLLGPGEALNEAATASFSLLATHIRDGRTPNSARKQWFMRDTDAKARPMAALLTEAVAGDPARVLTSLEPVHPGYGALKATLARTPATDKRARERLLVNLERWRWMPADLGDHYILSNVPEMMTRVVENGVTLATHKAVVGKVSTPTPQLDARATAIILNPTWTLPKSIIAEGTGALIARNPAAARAQGYTWSGKGANLMVVQKPGPGNALGRMKLEMLNEHAIYLHDTPSKAAFGQAVRAFSHGCIRTDRALHFSGLMAVRYGKQTPDDFGQAVASGKTTRVAFEQPFPVYVAYWTAMAGADGKVATYNDLYGRDAPVVASFSKPGRQADVALAPPQLAAR